MELILEKIQQYEISKIYGHAPALGLVKVLHGRIQESKIWRHDSSKGLQSYIQHVIAGL